MEKFGPAYSIPLPFRVIAPRIIMSYGVDLFDDWQHYGLKTRSQSSSATTWPGNKNGCKHEEQRLYGDLPNHGRIC
eukprot:6625970-Pyramimonas_sp.AAC.1